MHDRLQIGLEFNPAADEIGPIANWILQPESEKRPMLSLGTSSDRIGTPPGYQTVYLTAAKTLPDLPLAPYVSVAYSGLEEKLVFPFGANVALHEQWDLLAMNDGRKSHLLLTYKQGAMNVTAMWVWLKRPGISVGWGF